MYTIKREIGRLENFSIGLVGDLANGRTVRSLAYLLSMYPGVKMYFVAPEVVRMKDDIKHYLDRCAWRGSLPFRRRSPARPYVRQCNTVCSATAIHRYHLLSLAAGLDPFNVLRIHCSMCKRHRMHQHCFAGSKQLGDHAVLHQPTTMPHRKGVEWEEVDDLKAVAADVDVLYQTRIQKVAFFCSVVRLVLCFGLWSDVNTMPFRSVFSTGWRTMLLREESILSTANS